MSFGISRELKNREKQKRFFESEAEYLIPPKIKRSARCDAAFIYRKCIEIFYKKHPVGLDRPDFILFPNKKTLGFDQPVFLECKMGEKIDDASRQQLKTYLKSAPLNSNPNISNISMGILLHFQKKESFNENNKQEAKRSGEC